MDKINKFTKAFNKGLKKKTGFDSDEMIGFAARSGLGGLSSVLDLPSLGVNAVKHLRGSKNSWRYPSEDVKGVFDKLTGGKYAPRSKSHHVAESLLEVLGPAGALKAAAKVRKIPKAINFLLPSKGKELTGALVASPTARLTAIETDDPLKSFIAGVAGGATGSAGHGLSKSAKNFLKKIDYRAKDKNYKNLSDVVRKALTQEEIARQKVWKTHVEPYHQIAEAENIPVNLRKFLDSLEPGLPTTSLEEKLSPHNLKLKEAKKIRGTKDKKGYDKPTTREKIFGPFSDLSRESQKHLPLDQVLSFSESNIPEGHISFKTARELEKLYGKKARNAFEVNSENAHGYRDIKDALSKELRSVVEKRFGKAAKDNIEKGYQKYAERSRIKENVEPLRNRKLRKSDYPLWEATTRHSDKDAAMGKNILDLLGESDQTNKTNYKKDFAINFLEDVRLKNKEGKTSFSPKKLLQPSTYSSDALTSLLKRAKYNQPEYLKDFYKAAGQTREPISLSKVAGRTIIPTASVFQTSASSLPKPNVDDPLIDKLYNFTESDFRQMSPEERAAIKAYLLSH